MSDDPTTPSQPSRPAPVLAVWEDFRLALRRFAQGDFHRIDATEAERAKLQAASPPITGELAQDYAAWRRSILFVAAICLAVSSVFAIVRFQTVEHAAIEAQMAQFPDAKRSDVRTRVREYFGTSNLATLDWAPWLELLILLLSTVLTAWAAWRWSSAHSSRRLARRAGYLWIGIPLLMALVPWGALLDFGHLPKNMALAAKTQTGIMLGMVITMMLGPKILSIFPGVIRSALILKTLVPETSAPAWLAALCAPLYMLVLVLAIAAINQTNGNALLFFAVFFLAIAPFSYLRFMRSLLRPLDRKTASDRIRRARTLGYILNGIGGLLAFIFLLQLDFMTWDGAIRVILTMTGGLMLMMVISNDFLIAILRVSHAQGSALYGTEMADRLGQKLDALSLGGFGDLRTKGKGRTPTPKPEDDDS